MVGIQKKNPFMEVMGCLFFFTLKLQEKDFKTKNKSGGPTFPMFIHFLMLKNSI